jgi:predicted dienelactone hydrolase
VVIPSVPMGFQQAVRDAQAQDGCFPLIVFSHGYNAYLRQSTYLVTHLASHGYVVVAMDHVGNTLADEIAGTTPSLDDTAALKRFTIERPTDCSFVIDQMLTGDTGIAINSSRIGISGYSFGGWTSLMTSGLDKRIKAALALAPSGGISDNDPLINSIFADSLNLDWDREVPVLSLVAELDSVLPLAGMRDLHGRIRQPRTTVVLKNADHFHFQDHVELVHDMTKRISPANEVSEMKDAADLCPGEKANTFTRGLGLAHFDANLRANDRAVDLLNGDIKELMASHGIDVEVWT